MGKASYNLSNRLKAIALDRKKNCNRITGREELTPQEEIAECRAKIRQCRADMERLGESSVIAQKMVMYAEKIKIAEAKLTEKK